MWQYSRLCVSWHPRGWADAGQVHVAGMQATGVLATEEPLVFMLSMIFMGFLKT